MLDPALRDRFYVTTMDFLPNEVEIEVLEKKTGVSNEQAREIISVANNIRANSELGIDVSTRKILMIGEMIAAGGTLREAIVTSLQTDKKTLESVLLSLHVNLGKVEKSRAEYVQYIAA